MSDMKKQTFLQGAFILVCANLLVKVIGAGFKIPLTYIIDEDGMGLFSAAYQIYTVLFIIATAGFPIAISKMVSESVALGRAKEADKIFKVALIILSVVGIVGTLIIYFGADAFSRKIAMPRTADGLRAIAPAVFFVALMSTLRGYFQGHQNMYPTAVSEVTEAVVKLAVGYFLAYTLMNTGVEKAAAGAIFGVTCGTVFGFLVLLLLFARMHNRGVRVTAQNENCRSAASLARQLIYIAVPITVGASVASLTSLVDMATVARRLQSITAVTDEFMARYGSLTANVSDFSGAINENIASKLYGLYSGYAIPLFNLPLTIIAAISMSVVPAISSAIAKKDKVYSRLVTTSSVRITVLLSLPCCVGLYVLAGPVLRLLYNNGLAGTMLQKLAIAVPFVSLLSVTSAILQAYSRPVIPMVNMFIGGVVKIAVNYVLVGMPRFNIDGAPIGTIVCYFIIFCLNMFWVIRITKCRFGIVEFIVKPIVAAGLMGVAARLLYFMFLNANISYRIGVIASIGISAGIYLLLILLISAIRREDIEMLPGGEKIAACLTKARLLR